MDYSTATARLQFEPEPQSTYLTCAQYLGEKYALVLDEKANFQSMHPPENIVPVVMHGLTGNTFRSKSAHFSEDVLNSSMLPKSKT